MAATVTLGRLFEVLAKMVGNTADNATLLNDNLKIVKAAGGAQMPATGTLEFTLIAKTEAALRLKEAHLMAQATLAAAAASRDWQIQYDDGAGGTAVTLTSLYDGTATAVTAAVRNAMTVTAGVIIPAGSRVYVESTVNSTGAAADIQCDAEFAYE